MRWNLIKLIVVTVAVLAALWITTVQAQETAARLRWKNGDVLPGKLLESKPGTVRWVSPHFSDDLVIDVSVLDSIPFPKQSALPTEAFRIGTVSGDVWTADLVGADDQTFLFSSKHYGQVRVNRDAIYTLDRWKHPNLVFDGSQLTAWELPKADESEDPFLFDADAAPDWQPDAGGHPQTNRAKASIFHAFDWPRRFEVTLEFTSTEGPGFVLALGENVDEALRLETWADEVVIVQDKLFEPVLTIEKNQRSVRLQLAFDGIDGVLQVFDLTGRLLVKLDGVRPTVEDSGLHIHNRGKDLTIRRLSVYRQPDKSSKQLTDSSKPRIHMTDRQIVYGRLFVSEGTAYVLDADGTRRDINLEQIDRIVRPGIELMETSDPAELTYADGSVLRGRIEQLRADRVILRTAFSDEAVICALAGAAQLLFRPTTETSKPSEDDDQLFYPSGRLRGRISFDGADASPIRWQPVGASSVRLANSKAARVERSSESVLQGLLFDTDQFPNVLHLKNGEVIPCQVLSYNEQTLGFQSPFIKGTEIESTHVKAIEFKPSKRPQPNEKPSSELEKWLSEIHIAEQETSFGIDLIKLERALTVPRFNRDNPPSHLLMANTGDLKRGKLLGINEQTIQFDSKLRKLTIPTNRMTRVVDVSKPEENRDKPIAINNTPDVIGHVRVTLTDGSILIFEPLESKNGKIKGRSPIYGAMAVPVSSIHHLHFGDDEAKPFKSVFEEWVVRPAKEPEFGGDL